MTRVSSFGHNQAMVNSLLTNQSKVFEDQTQINTGKKSNQYSGFSREANTLLGAKSLLSRTESYKSSTSQVLRQLDTNDQHLSNMETVVDDLRQTMIDTIGQGEAYTFREALDVTFQNLVGALNSNIGGVYMFSGSRSDVKPVDAIGLTDLINAPTANSLFQNDQKRPAARIDEGTTVEYGLLADEIASDIFAVMKTIAEYDDGVNGPIEGELTSAQKSFLQAELLNLDTAIEGLRNVIAENGTRNANPEDKVAQHQSNANFLEIFISDIEDVDLTEAVTRLQNDQVALEVSYSIVGELGKLSLLNYL